MIKKIHLDITDGCNTKCIMCDLYDNDYKNKSLDIASIKRLEPLLSSVETIWVGCDAEISMHPDIEQVLGILGKATHVNVLSNGRLLGRENVQKAIVENVDVLRISFDGSRKETFEKIRGGIPFEKVVESIKRLKAKKPELIVGFAVTLMAENIAELPDILDLAHELGVEIVDYGYVVINDKAILEQTLFFQQEKSDHYMEIAANKARHYGIAFHPRYFTKVSKHEYIGPSHIRGIDVRDVNFSFSGHETCSIYQDEVWLRYSGVAAVCARRPIGNLYMESLDTVLENQNRLLESIAQDKETFCKGCNNCYIRDHQQLEAHVLPHLLPLAVMHLKSL